MNANLTDILSDCEKKALVSLDGAVDFKLRDKIKNGRLYVEQGIIAGCAGGGFENICDAADILKGTSIGPDEFTLSVYPASTPIYMELVKNGAVASLMATGAIVKTAFCGPCFGAGDPPFDEKLPEPRGLKAPERSDFFGCSYGCPFNRSYSGKQRLSDSGDRHRCRLYKAKIFLRQAYL